jgi:ATP-dependent DNA ligase
MAELVEPMLARLVDELPIGDYAYEPKWDGFRCIAMRADEGVTLMSRHGRPFTRYFPEIVEALASIRSNDLTLDGEILVDGPAGFDFAALLARLHPAESRVRRLRTETPARFMAFDVPWLDGEDLSTRAFIERRRRLEEVLAVGTNVAAATPMTLDRDVALGWLAASDGRGIDGVVAKPLSLGYEPGRRSMLKVKVRRTADCVVAGYRWMMDRRELGSLLLALYDDDDRLRHVGVASSFDRATRARLEEELAPLAVPLGEHPWVDGFLIDRSPLGRLKGAPGRWTPDMAMDWVPLRLDRVCEVEYDRFDRDRFRHPARLLRWRPDRDARSCTFEQLRPAPVERR